MTRLVALTCVALSLLGGACGEPVGTAQETAVVYELPGQARFATAVAQPVDRGFETYWLGEEFSAGEVRLRGPSFAERGMNDAELFAYVYVADPIGPEFLELFSLTPQRWREFGARLMGPRAATPEQITVGSWQADLYREEFTGEFKGWLVVIHVDERTLVVAQTSINASRRDATPPSNPLIETETLIDVLADLRPYPQ